MKRLAVYDPGNEYSVPYMWYTTGIAFDVKKARQRVGDRALDTWETVFNPETLKQFASCGVYMIDSPEDVLTSALRYLHLDPNSKKADDLRKAADAVLRVKSSVKKFHSSEYINALANGDICLALAILKDAPHPAEAYAFVDYLLRPDVAARNSVAIQYANGVLASKSVMDQSVLDNKAIYPGEDVMARLYTVSPNDLATQRIITREWTRVKTGR
jgi:putrescine transport system substrate-binding protein